MAVRTGGILTLQTADAHFSFGAYKLYNGGPQLMQHARPQLASVASIGVSLLSHALALTVHWSQE